MSIDYGIKNSKNILFQWVYRQEYEINESLQDYDFNNEIERLVEIGKKTAQSFKMII